jgi:hypothetical protein
MLRLVEVFWRLLPAVRTSERSRSLFFTALLTLVSAAQTLGLAGSEALLLARLGTERLPEIFVGASLATVLGTMLYAARVGETRNDLLFFQMLVASALGLVAAAVGIEAGIEALLPVVFSFFYLTTAVFVNHFWTFSGDYFDTLTSKRLFPVFTIGASVGGLLGGSAAAALTPITGAVGLLYAWAGLLVAAAALLAWARRPLRRWGPLELEEADETSVEGLRGAAEYLVASPLGRWLVLSAAGMVIAIFLAQYLYSEIFAREYPSPERLAAFFGLYLATTNAIEIALEVAITPWLIRRFGVATAQLVHPITTLLSFGGLALGSGLAAGIGARVNRELLENAIAQPVRALVYNALPQRLRGRIRAFLEGIVVYAGMAVAGGLLWALGDPDPRWLAGLGGVAALLYLLASWRARRAYLDELVTGIRAGRLDLDELDEDIGAFDVQSLVSLCERWLEQEQQRPSHSLLRLLSNLGRRGIEEPLLAGAEHSHPEVRRISIAGLAPLVGDGPASALRRALDDPDPRVRRTALAGLTDAGSMLPTELLALRLRDPDPDVRALAGTLEDADDFPTLRAMLDQDDTLPVCAALAVAPSRLGAIVTGYAASSEPTLRAAAFDRASDLDGAQVPADLLADAMSDASAPVRSAALRFLARSDPTAQARVAEALADPSRNVREVAIRELVAAGPPGAEIAIPYIRHGSELAAASAVRVVSGAAPAQRALDVLRAELRHRAEEMWRCVLAYQQLPEGSQVVHAFLRVAFADALLGHRRTAFKILGQLENERIIRSVDRALQSGTRTRSDALEVLSNLGDRVAAELLVLVHETSPLEDRATAVDGWVRVPGDAAGVLREAVHSAHPWIRGAAAALEPTLGETPLEVETMERLLALKRVSLFENLTLDQLDAVRQLTREAEFLAGEVIVREGAPGDELYILLEGRVDVMLGWETPQATKLGEMQGVDYFGEMAILDREPRSVTIVAAENSRLLSLDGQSLKDLIQQMPEISFEILRVLTTRVRRAEQRLREE